MVWRGVLSRLIGNVDGWVEERGLDWERFDGADC